MEEQGTVERFRLVRVMGPRNREDTYRCFFSVTESPLKEEGGRFASLEECVRSFREHQLAGARFEEERRTEVGGLEAVDLTVTYVVPPPLQRGLKPLDIPVKTRTLLLQRDRSLYRIAYSADAREYDAHAGAFEKALASLRFL